MANSGDSETVKEEINDPKVLKAEEKEKVMKMLAMAQQYIFYIGLYIITIQEPEKTPRIKNKSLSLPEQPITAGTAAAMAGGAVTSRPALATSSQPQQSPTVNRRQSAPPLSATPPSQGVNTSPSVSRKKLIYTQRPLSKHYMWCVDNGTAFFFHDGYQL